MPLPLRTLSVATDRGARERTPVFYWLLKYVVLGPVLKCLFRRIEIAEVAEQCTDCLWARRNEGRIDPVRVVHGKLDPGLKMPTGLIS